MPVHRLSLLVFVFLLPANQMARAQKVTWIDAQNACMRVARCESVHDTVAALCDFADDPLNGAVPTTLPSPDEVRAVLGCKERAGLGAPGSLRIASLSFSAVDQSTLLWGATDFLMRRASEELQAWFLDRFYDKVCSDGAAGHLGGKDLFPESCLLLKDRELLPEFAAGLATLREAFHQDLNDLPWVIIDHAVATIPKEKKDLSLVAAMSARATHQIVDGVHPWFALRSLEDGVDAASLSCSDTPFASRAYVLSVVAGVVPPDERGAPRLPNHPEDWPYVALAVAIEAKTRVDAGKWPSACPGQGVELEMLVGKLETLHGHVEAMRGVLQQIEAALKDPDSSGRRRLEALARTLEVSLGLMEQWAGIDSQALDGQSGRIYLAARKVLDRIARGNYGGAVLALHVLITELGTSPKLPRSYLRIISFAADVAQAEDAGSVSAAIASYAAPAGAYKRKRLTDGWYFSLNSYLGLAAGAERAGGEWAFTGAAFAPLGVELGRSNGKWAFGLFAQALDLGALTAWRVGSNGIDERPEVGLEQVFSPGGYVVVGFPDAPYSLAIGVSYTPKLRFVEEGMTLDGCGSEGCAAMRVGATFAIDVPLLQ